MNIENAIQTFAPDKQKIAELVIRAKGKNRTMAQFANDTGISAPTLSRIANGKISNPLAKDVLEKIFAARCVDADITVDLLLMANGMTDPGTAASGTINWSKTIQAKEYGIALERHAKNAIVTAVLDRGVCVRSVPSDLNRLRIESPFGIALYPDFSLYIPDEKQQLWYFDVLTGQKRIPAGFSNTFAQAGRLFLLDAWAPEFLANVKYSFMFEHKTMYTQFVLQYKGAPIRSAVTAILFDPETEQIIEETWLSMTPEVPGILSKDVTSSGEIATCMDEDDDEE